MHENIALLCNCKNEYSKLTIILLHESSTITNLQKKTTAMPTKFTLIKNKQKNLLLQVKQNLKFSKNNLKINNISNLHKQHL